jgi:hypothetical protein
VDAALRSGVRADDVERVTVDAGLLTVAMESAGRGAGLTGVGVTFSTARSVAVALLAGRLTPAELEPAWLGEHRDAIEGLADRVTLRHDWSLSLQTARGVVDAGASVADVPARALPTIARRVRELAGDGGGPGALRPSAALDRRLAAQAVRLVRDAASARRGIDHLDTARLRMRFPCRLRLHLRSGGTVELEGTERGASATPLAEQRAVVEEKARLTGLAAAARQG